MALDDDTEDEPKRRRTQLSPEMKLAIENTARKSSDQAVRKTLISLGLDATTGLAIQEHQQDAAFVRRWRKTVEARSVHWMLAAITTFVSGMGGLLVLLIQNMMGKGQ